jgi:hypothetical protein
VNFTDLFVVIVLASALYGLVVAIAGRGNFLSRAVNPNRGTWLIAALSAIWVGIGLLRWEAGDWDLQRWGHLLRDLVTEGSTPARVKVASMAILLGTVFFVLVVWCRFNMPRDPSTFRHAEKRGAAFRYYVTKLRGGVDYALLARGDGERLEEAVYDKKVLLRCGLLPKVKCDDGEPRLRTVDEQVQFWRDAARTIHQRMSEMDALIEVAQHGRNRRIVFDTEYGGLFFQYVRVPDPRGKVDNAMYLFGATLNQAEMDNRRAEVHFRLLREALENVDRSIRIG